MDNFEEKVLSLIEKRFKVTVEIDGRCYTYNSRGIDKQAAIELVYTYLYGDDLALIEGVKPAGVVLVSAEEVKEAC